MSQERPNPNSYVRGFVEEGSEWQHQKSAQTLYEFSDVFRYYFLGSLPQPLIAIEKMRVEILAAYRLKENPNGLPYEIIMNEVYLPPIRSWWETLESELHEMVHLYQETQDGLERSKNGSHNKQFVGICEEIGLHPMLGVGAHWKPADGQFERLMDRYCIPKPEAAYGEFPDAPAKGSKASWWDGAREKRSGSSTLKLWECSCVPPVKVRTGRPNLAAVCLNCGEPFKMV